MPKVLTIDDSRTLRAIVRGTLTQHGFEVIEAESGAEGLQKARLLRPDAILLDLHMPVMNGREMLLRLRGDPVTSRLPVIVLTTEAAHETVVELVKAGIEGYVVKPFQAVDLIAKLQRAMAAASAVRTTGETSGSSDPASAAATPALDPAIDEDGGVMPSGGRPVVLAVDDTPDVLDFLEEHFAEGVEFLRASSGLEAVNRIQESAPDAVLLDLEMPGVTGADVFRETAALLKGHGSLVWGMSSASREDDIVRARRAGIRKFLAKPFDESELAGIVDTIRQRSISS